jgi:carbonic anhydrase
VAATPIEADQDEIWGFQSKMGVNGRPVQALNARPLVKPD